MEVPKSCLFCAKNLSTPRFGRNKKVVDLFTDIPVDQFNKLWKHLAHVEEWDFQNFTISPPVCVECGKFGVKIIELLALLEKETVAFQKLFAGRDRNGVFKVSKELHRIGADPVSSDKNEVQFEIEPKFFFNEEFGSPAPADITDEEEIDDKDFLRKHTRSSNSVLRPRKRRKIVVICDESASSASENDDHSSDEDYLYEESPPKPPKLPKPLPGAPKLIRSLVLECDLCSEKVPREELQLHVRNHVGDYSLKCPNPKCGYYFCTIGRYKDHSKRIRISCKSFYNKNNSFDKCQLCGLETTLQALRIHMLLVHETGDSKLYSCPVPNCDEKFCHRETVYFHIGQRHAPPYIRKFVTSATSQKCPECLETFSNEDIVAHYKDDHDVSENDITSCKYCSYKGMNIDQLWSHLVVHFRNGTVVSCDICPEEVNFSRLATLKRHYMETHKMGQTVICDQCTSQFTSTKSLWAHRKQFHSENPVSHQKRGFACEECPESNPKSYSTQPELRNHKILMHNAEPWKCSTCKETFTNYKAYQDHEKGHKNITLMKSEFICDIGDCRHVCASSVALELHKTSIKHLGKTNAFICEECGMGFNSKQGRRSHYKLVHIGERPFVCDTCGNAFKTKLSLRTHMLLHTNSKPEECPVCHKRFRQKQHVRNHMKMHKVQNV